MLGEQLVTSGSEHRPLAIRQADAFISGPSADQRGCHKRGSTRWMSLRAGGRGVLAASCPPAEEPEPGGRLFRLRVAWAAR